MSIWRLQHRDGILPLVHIIYLNGAKYGQCEATYQFDSVRVDILWDIKRIQIYGTRSGLIASQRSVMLESIARPVLMTGKQRQQLHYFSIIIHPSRQQAGEHQDHQVPRKLERHVDLFHYINQSIIQVDQSIIKIKSDFQYRQHSAVKEQINFE